MSESVPVSIDAVRALVAERQRFDQWLSALEARRAETPVHVYDRVRADYASRRSGVLEQLHDQAPALATLLAELDERASALASQVQAQEDERAEAMLRHAVGEFDDVAWDAVRERVEQALGELQGARDGVEAQRDELRGLLDEARPAPAHGESEPGAVEAAGAAMTPPEDEAGDRPHTDAGGPSTAVAADAASSPSATAHGDVRSEEALRAGPAADAPTDVERWRTAGPERSAGAETDEAVLTSAGDQAPGRAATVTETLAAIDADVVDPVDLGPEGAPRPPMSAVPRFWGSPASAPAPSAGPAGPSDPTGALEGGTTSGIAPDAGAASPPADAFDDLAFLRSVIDPGVGAASSMAPKAPGMGEPQKTLRCTECSTMNLPTEWYCERCGGELASF